MTTDALSMASGSRQRAIGPWGRTARAVVGVGLLGGAVVLGVSTLDALIGLVALPAVATGGLALRGRSAQPLRLGGSLGHCWAWAVGILLFVVVAVPAMLFYGASMLLAAVTGSGGCEISAVSNWLRGRDDQVVCPVFSPVDELEARATGRTQAC